MATSNATSSDRADHVESFSDGVDHWHPFCFTMILQGKTLFIHSISQYITQSCHYDHNFIQVFWFPKWKNNIYQCFDDDFITIHESPMFLCPRIFQYCLQHFWEQENITISWNCLKSIGYVFIIHWSKDKCL